MRALRVRRSIFAFPALTGAQIGGLRSFTRSWSTLRWRMVSLSIPGHGLTTNGGAAVARLFDGPSVRWCRFGAVRFVL
jgi:hypothetical protein